ncbi:Membrane protein involved in the export of O-antigen and teichoic acid [Halolactibacillus halophilus]|uniref:Membrane protein involved in the export of O-antigen and teichoic acid n=1 Tax=Halolactibacillus halophilus TaxID=306540 RepID=A0A1I5QFT8_9BACI|nr:oligosaccharide flippase family protein [Halolactibacillus halophilus]GEM02101.1 polysaccharide biosynthesis protein [Halolactibacillus halophilus]SFP44726.1 Membrane protein involved in the export of O-antigen and teichoic acid [Halolactibacillus halophilus]
MKQTIASDALKLTTSKIITMVLSMLAAMLLSRFRTLEEYGTYSQLLLVINLITTVIMMGLPNSINFFLARAETKESRQKFLSIYYTLSTLLGFLTGLVLVLSTPLIVSYFSNPLIEKFIYILAIFPWTKIILSSIDHVLIVYGKPNSVMLFRVLNSIAILLTIFLVELFDLSFSYYMIMFIVLESLFAIVVYFIVYSTAGKLRFNFDLKDTRNILKFSLPLGLASVVGRLSVELDKLVIGRFFSTEDIAIYTNAAREMPVTIIASALTAVLMPRLVRLLRDKEYDDAVNIWGNSIEISFIIICFVSFGLIVFAPEVISLLYSEKYLPGVAVFRVYSLVLLLRVTYFGMILNSIGKTKFIFYSSILSLLINVILNYIFYLIFGFIGPAYASFISILLVQLLQLFATAKSIDVKFTSIFPWAKLGRLLAINTFLAVFFILVKEQIHVDYIIGSILEAILLGAIWGIVYLILIRKNIIANWKVLNQ